jgi:chemotaxis protein MotB
MARPTDWDETPAPMPGEAEQASQASRGRTPPSPPAPQARSHAKAARFGWLLTALFAVGAFALGALALERQAIDRAQLATARDEAAELRRSLFSTEDRLIAAERERAQKTKTADALEAALATRGAQAEETEKTLQQLRAQLDAKDGDIAADGKKISVSLVDEILFPSGEAELSPRGKEVLGKVGGVLKGLTDQQVLVGGHTDTVPIHNARFASNWELSSARAVNVARYLAEAVGVDPHRIIAAGYSEFHPRSKDRAKNRRIEILLTPLVEVKPR